MMIDFECNSCNGGFEIDVADLIEDPKPIKCTHCKSIKLDAKTTEDFASVLEDLIAQISSMSKKFNVSMTIETDDLPNAYHEDEDDDEEDIDDDEIDLDDEELDDSEDDDD